MHCAGSDCIDTRVQKRYHPPTHEFHPRVFCQGRQATQLQGIWRHEGDVGQRRGIRSDVVEVVKKSEVVRVEVVTSNVVRVEVVGSKCSQSRSSRSRSSQVRCSRSSRVRCSRSRSSQVRCSRSSREVSTKEQREGASSRCCSQDWRH